MMYFRKKMKRSNNGTVTKTVAAICKPYSGSPEVEVKELRKPLVIKRHSCLLATKFGQT